MFTAVVEMLRWFAGHQIRNVAVSACRFKCTFFFMIFTTPLIIKVPFKICILYSIYTNQSWVENSLKNPKNMLLKKCQIPGQSSYSSYFCVYNFKKVKNEFQVLGCNLLCRSHSKQQTYLD